MESKVNNPPRRTRITRGVILYSLTFFGVLTLNFFLPRAMPGNPVDALLGPDSQVSMAIDSEIRDRLLEYYKLDLPLHEQYIHYISRTFRGDLGWGIYFQQPVSDLILKRLKWSFFIIVTASLLSVLIASPLAALSAMNRGGRKDSVLLVVFLFLSSAPVFLVSMLFLVIFSVKLGWLPLAGAVSELSGDGGLFYKLKDVSAHGLGPVLVLSIAESPALYLVGRSSMINALDQPWLEFAVLRGLSKSRLVFAYLIPAGILPVITRLGTHVAFLIAGTVFVETIFSYPGLGGLLFQAVQVRDYPVLQGVFLVMTVTVLCVNFLVDLSYGYLDPRIGANE